MSMLRGVYSDGQMIVVGMDTALCTREVSYVS